MADDTLVHLDGYRREPPEDAGTVCLTEAGLYRLMFEGQTEKPEVKRFRWWLFHEVLPKIRRTGTYADKHGDMQRLFGDAFDGKIPPDRFPFYFEGEPPDPFG